jgi:hypothetical protein
VTGPNGTAVRGSYDAAGTRANGTRYTSNQDLNARGDYVRNGYGGANYFSPSWYARYPGAWSPAAYTGPIYGAGAGWGGVAGYGGYPMQPSYYDYGGNVVSQPTSMYVNGDPTGTPQQYGAQAAQIAGAGTAQPADANAAWQPIGVFAIDPERQSPPPEFFQIAINPQGLIRGNFFDASAKKAEQINGSVDKNSLRAAWTIGQTKSPIFEAGIANLTKDQTTMLMHDDSGRSQQLTLVRMPPPDQNDGGGQAPPQQQ